MPGTLGVLGGDLTKLDRSSLLETIDLLGNSTRQVFSTDGYFLASAHLPQSHMRQIAHHIDGDFIGCMSGDVIENSPNLLEHGDQRLPNARV